ncbi:MAG: hypothetical protein WCV62_01535 [Candidatus Peribacteraceae bacterium]|jgi:hypothetical protein
MQNVSIETLPFTKDSDVFHAFQVFWKDEIGEELSYERAQDYGPKILAMVALAARSRHIR